MLRATSVIRKAAVKAERVADTITLDHEARQRRRLTLTADGGLVFVLDLDGGAGLEDGDALKLDDGRLVRVAAAPQQLLRITTDNPLRLMKVGWHLGNRHVAAEITAEALFIEDDHVLAEMVRGLGAKADAVTRPFRPERGAYAGEHGHGHGEAHAHAHAEGSGHGHAHAHGNGHAHAHAHTHGCGCDHAHGDDAGGHRHDHPRGG